MVSGVEKCLERKCDDLWCRRTGRDRRTGLACGVDKKKPDLTSSSVSDDLTWEEGNIKKVNNKESFKLKNKTHLHMTLRQDLVSF